MNKLITEANVKYLYIYIYIYYSHYFILCLICNKYKANIYLKQSIVVHLFGNINYNSDNR